jgi:hypothetical protein
LAYSFDKDFENIVLVAAAVGAVGGLMWDVANPIRRFSKKPVAGLENRLTAPRFFKSGETRGVDLGVLGPILLGATAGILVVLLAGRSGPDGQDVMRELSKLAGAEAQEAAGGSAAQAAATEAAASSAEEALATKIEKPTFYVLAFLGGIAGWALLEALASRLSSLFQVVVRQSGAVVGEAAATAVTRAGQEQQVDAAKTKEIADAAREAVTKKTVALAAPEPAD